MPSGRYQARYLVNGRWVNADHTFETESAADVWLASVELALHRGEWTKSELSSITFKEWAERWVALPKKRKKVGKKQTATSKKAVSTVKGYEGVLSNHVYPLIGDIPISRITLEVVYQYQGDLEEKLEEKWRTNEKAQDLTRWVLAFARRKGAIQFNPYDDEEVILPSVDSRREAVQLEIENVTKLLEKIDPRFRVAVLVAAYCGLRSGEVWALRRRSVNLLKNEIEVSESRSDETGLTGPTKNGKVRYVPLPTHVRDALRLHVESNVGDPEEWLFKSPKGFQVQHNNFYNRYFRDAIKVAELPKRMVFHDLRHFCARFYISQGAAAYNIMYLLGHSSIQVTMDIYGGLFDEQRREMANLADVAYNNYISPSEVVRLRELQEVVG